MRRSFLFLQLRSSCKLVGAYSTLCISYCKNNVGSVVIVCMCSEYSDISGLRSEKPRPENVNKAAYDCRLINDYT